MRWSGAGSPVAPGGELADTALFPWRPGDDAYGSTLDEPAPVVAREVRRAPWVTDLGLLIARLVVGVTAVLEGSRLVLGLPGPTSRPVVEAMLAGYGFVRPDLLATYLGWGELVAGVLLVLGLGASLAAAALLSVATTAVAVTVPLALAAGAIGPVRGPAVSATLAALLVLAGPGRVSADSGRPWWRAQNTTGAICLVLGVGAGLAVAFVLR